MKVGRLLLFTSDNGKPFLFFLGFQFAQQFTKPIHPILAYHQFVQMKGVQNWSHLELNYMGHLQPTLGIYVDIKCDQAQELLEEVRFYTTP